MTFMPWVRDAQAEKAHGTQAPPWLPALKNMSAPATNDQRRIEPVEIGGLRSPSARPPRSVTTGTRGIVDLIAEQFHHFEYFGMQGEGIV
jgi:hypothetical protein